jgi:hypothetical protein
MDFTTGLIFGCLMTLWICESRYTKERKQLEREIEIWKNKKF